MTRLPVPDKFTDEHGNRWRLLAGPFERPREDAEWQSAIDSLAAGRINSYPWLHEDGRFYLYRDARGWKEWEGRRTALFRSVRAAVVLLTCAVLAGCGVKPSAPADGQWTATVAGDTGKASVRPAGNDVTMEVRTYPKQLGTYAVARTDAAHVMVETFGDWQRTCVFITEDPSWEVRHYVGDIPLHLERTKASPVWIVVETGKAKATVIP